MVLTKKDIDKLHIILSDQENKELVIRLFVSAMISGTNVTAPEIRTCTQQIINTLAEPEVKKEVIKVNHAE